MAGTAHASGPAWASIVLMIVGFTMGTFAFVLHNNIPLYVAGGVIGAVGVVLAFIYDIMDGESPASGATEKQDTADVL